MLSLNVTGHISGVGKKRVFEFLIKALPILEALGQLKIGEEPLYEGIEQRFTTESSARGRFAQLM